MHSSPAPDLIPLVAKLKADGYFPVHWVAHAKGVRVHQTGGKVSIPSSYTKGRVCMVHGNLVKVRHETGGKDRGIRILDVQPCLFCSRDPVGWIQKSPKTW